jgi:hypothetical protein
MLPAAARIGHEGNFAEETKTESKRHEHAMNAK